MTSPPAARETVPSDGNVLAAEPATVTGVMIGYARVSTTAQLLDRQFRALDDAGCAKDFSDQLSGRDADRPELQACLAYPSELVTRSSFPASTGSPAPCRT